MTNLSKAHPVRLNPEESHLLGLLERLMSPERFEYLVTEDRAKREGYRGHSGRKPQLRSLLLRRAVELGLPLVSQELGGIERRARSHVDQDAVATTLIGEDSVRLLDSIRDDLVHAHDTDTHCPSAED